MLDHWTLTVIGVLLIWKPQWMKICLSQTQLRHKVRWCFRHSNCDNIKNIFESHANIAAILALNINLVHCPCFQLHVILLDFWNSPRLENSMRNAICKYRWNDHYFLAKRWDLGSKAFFQSQMPLTTPSWGTTFVDILVANVNLLKDCTPRYMFFS